MATHYEILEIAQDATEEEIKKAYRKLALVYHPDKNSFPDAQSKFLAVQAAYDILSNPNKRQDYDAKLAAKQEGILGEDGLDEFFYSSLEDIYQKLPKIIEDYSQVLKNKTMDVDIICLKIQFLFFLSNVLFKKIFENLLSSNKDTVTHNNEKIEADFRKLLGKFEEQALLKTRKEVLLLQDSLQEHINNYIKQNKGDCIKQNENPVFDKPPKMEQYKNPFRIIIEIPYVDGNVHKDWNRRELVIEAVKNSPFKNYLEAFEIPSNSNDQYVVRWIDFKININYFKTKTELKLEDEESPDKVLPLSEADKINNYKNSLLDYIEKRSEREKYTGFRCGYSRKEKVEAAQALYDLFSGRNTLFFHDSPQTNLARAALKQGKLGESAKEAMEYAEKNLKPKR